MMPFSPLVIASHNAGKVREIAELLVPCNVEVISAAALGLAEPEENGASFEANAAIKSTHAAASGHWALADDSGLCVEALGGAPGIYSARWAGATKDFAAAAEKIRHEIERVGADPQGAHAYFICVLSLCSPQGEVKAFEGRIDGRLTFPPRGAKGFGYDPIFIPDGFMQTFAEMDAAQKHSMSHRARAFEKFIAYVKDRLTGEAA